MKTADQLREIVGQETVPPLWIYVTKDQIPVLEKAARDLDSAAEAQQAAFDPENQPSQFGTKLIDSSLPPTGEQK